MHPGLLNTYVFMLMQIQSEHMSLHARGIYVHAMEQLYTETMHYHMQTNTFMSA